MSSASADLKGAREIRARLAKLAHAMPRKAEQAIYLQAEYIMADAKKSYVPVDLGTLRASGRVDKPVREGDSIAVHMHFGDESAPYALTVHEHPSPHDPPSWRGKVIEFSPAGHGSKYLELPLKKAIPDLVDRMLQYLEIKEKDLS